MKLPKRVTKTTQAFAGLPQTAQLVIMGVLAFLAFTMGNCKGTDKLPNTNNLKKTHKPLHGMRIHYNIKFLN